MAPSKLCLGGVFAAITNAEMRNALTVSAVDIMAAGSDRDSGGGIVMAFEALLALGATGSANPELGTVIATDHPGNGNGLLEAGETGIITLQLKNTGGVQDATAISASLTTTTAGVNIAEPSVSVYADLPRFTGVGNNLSPFIFTLANDYPCGQPIDFALHVNSAVTFTCSGLPPLAGCGFNPSLLIPGVSDASTKLTLSTTARTASESQLTLETLPLSICASFTTLGLFLATGQRRRILTKRVSLATLTLVVLLLLTACGGTSSRSANPGTPAGTYTVTITATADAATHPTAFQLVVN